MWGKWRVARENRPVLPCRSGNLPATSPCATWPSLPRSAVIRPKRSGSGKWSSTHALAMPRPWHAGMLRSESRSLPQRSATATHSAPASEVSRNTANPAPTMKRPWALRGGTTTPCSTHKERQPEPRQDQTAEQTKLRLPRPVNRRKHCRLEAGCQQTHTDQDGGHAGSEGDHEQDPDRQSTESRGEHDQTDRIPARNQATGQAQAHQAGRRHGDWRRLAFALVVFPPSQISTDPPESSRGYGKTGHLHQSLVQRGHLRCSCPPEERGDPKHAAGVSQRGGQSQECRLVPASLGSQGNCQHKGLAMSWLDGMNGPQTRGDQNQADP